MENLFDVSLSAAATVLLQSTLILGVGIFIAMLVRSNPSLRHGILMSAFVITLGAGSFAIWNPSDFRGLQIKSPRQDSLARITYAPDPAAESRVAALGTENSEPAGAPLDVPPHSRPAPTGKKGFPWGALGVGLLSAWAAGSLLLLWKLVTGLVCIRGVTRRAQRLPMDRATRIWNGTTGSPGRDGRHPCPILTSVEISGPMVTGILRPKILIPKPMLEKLSEAELRAVLAHEVAHILRRDTVVGMLERLGHIALWPQPLIGILKRELDRSREEICDNYALSVSGPIEYGRLLLNLSSTFEHSRRLEPVAIGLFRNHWSLERRISDIINPKRNTMTKLSTKKQIFAPVATLAAIAVLAGGIRISFAEDAPGKKTAEEGKEFKKEGGKKEAPKENGERREGGETRNEKPKKNREGGERETRYNPRRPDVWASAASVSADGKSIDVVVKREGGGGEGGQTHTFAGDAEIVVDGRSGGIETVAGGATCKIWYSDAGGKVIGRLEVQGQEIGGRWGVLVRGVDAEKRTLTTGGENPANDQTYDVAADAEIIIGGKSGTLADVTTKEKIHFKTSADMATVIHIRQGENRGTER